MIKFFRRIRQQLLNENKTSKYFKYAIGEIVLVVIGILIALQINNWNEERKYNLKAKVYAEKLINDLISDTLNINIHISRGENYQKSINKYFKFFDEGNHSINVLIDSAMNVNYGFFRYLPINYTFKDMQSTGNSSLLTEEQRKILIELTNTQEFLQIIFEKTISNLFSETRERNKYLDSDMSSSDFYKTLSITQKEESKVKGLKHQHEMLSINYDLHVSMKFFGSRIKEQSKEAILLLQELLK
jgi:hypothetical protein